MKALVSSLLVFATFIGTKANHTQPHEFDYCHKDLCSKPETKHIACHNAGDFVRNCDPQAKIYHMGRSMRNVILTKHNNLRSRLAMGLRHFAAARRMATMRWSSELAFLAELNVKRCVMQRSKCTATVHYPNVGQNLAYNLFRGEQNETEIVSSQISMWFDEYMKADMGSIISGSLPIHVEYHGEIKHFLQLVRDRADRVGCAIAKYPMADQWTVQSLTCLYNVGVENCYPIYASSDVGGKSCRTGISTQYPFLCNVQEKYNYRTCPSAVFSGLPLPESTPAPCNPKARSGKRNIFRSLWKWYNANARTDRKNYEIEC